MSLNSSYDALPKRIYRRLLILTETWQGERVSPGSLVIKCHEGGSGLPLFWGGGETDLTRFVPVLGNDRSLYCLCGTWAVLPAADENIRPLAHYYLAEMLKIQPQGPYLLGGFCDGALLVYEMAKLLREQGHEVGILALFELDVTQQTLPLKIGRWLFPFVERLLMATRDADWLKRTQNKLLRTFSTLKNRIDPQEVPAFIPYELTEYKGVVDLIFIKWGMMGFYQWKFFQQYWQKLALGGLRIEIISGCLHDRPNWTAVAEIIQVRLKQKGY